jgi:hypothetical protein
VNGYSFAAGDSVLFREGDRWVGQLTVDWAGTASQRAIVGAYYLDGSTPVRGYRSSRPIIDGEDRLPAGRYDPLVFVRSDRVRVENLSVKNSEGRALYDDHTPNPTTEEIEARRIERTYRAAARAAGTPDRNRRRELRRLKESG